MKNGLPIPRYLGIAWWWLLVAGLIEAGIRYWLKAGPSFPFLTEFWYLVQGVWLKRAMPTSRAIYWYFGAVFASLLSIVPDLHEPRWLLALEGIASFPLAFSYVVGILTFRSEVEEHFTDPDIRWLSLSGWMTFFFSTLYFQYWFHTLYAEQQAEFAKTSNIETVPSLEKE